MNENWTKLHIVDCCNYQRFASSFIPTIERFAFLEDWAISGVCFHSVHPGGNPAISNRDLRNSLPEIDSWSSVMYLTSHHASIQNIQTVSTSAIDSAYKLFFKNKQHHLAHMTQQLECQGCGTSWYLIKHYGKTQLLKLQFLQPAEDQKLFESFLINKK